MNRKRSKALKPKVKRSKVCSGAIIPKPAKKKVPLVIVRRATTAGDVPKAPLVQPKEALLFSRGSKLDMLARLSAIIC